MPNNVLCSKFEGNIVTFYSHTPPIFASTCVQAANVPVQSRDYVSKLESYAPINVKPQGGGGGGRPRGI